MTQKRWKPITLWLTAAILTVIATAACVYSVARSAVERDAAKPFMVISDEGYTTDVRFRGVRFSGPMWLVFEFDVTFRTEDNTESAGPFHWRWRLREWDAVMVFYE